MKAACGDWAQGGYIIRGKSIEQKRSPAPKGGDLLIPVRPIRLGFLVGNQVVFLKVLQFSGYVVEGVGAGQWPVTMTCGGGSGCGRWVRWRLKALAAKKRGFPPARE